MYCYFQWIFFFFWHRNCEEDHIYEEIIEHVYESLDDLDISHKGPLPPCHREETRYSETSSKQDTPGATSNKLVKSKVGPMLWKLPAMTSDSEMSRCLKARVKPPLKKKPLPDCHCIEERKGQEENNFIGIPIHGIEGISTDFKQTDSEDSDEDEGSPPIPPRLYLLNPKFVTSESLDDCSVKPSLEKIFESSSKNRYACHKLSHSMDNIFGSSRRIRSSSSIPSSLNKARNPSWKTSTLPSHRKANISPLISAKRDHSLHHDSSGKSSTLPSHGRHTERQRKKQSLVDTHLYSNTGSICVSSDCDHYQPLIPAHHASHDSPSTGYAQVQQLPKLSRKGTDKVPDTRETIPAKRRVTKKGKH